MNKPYFILATPRSRTTWLTAYLYRDEFPARHDSSIEYPSLDVFDEALRAHPFGVIDTALAVHWRWIREHFPDSPLVCLMRPYDEVLVSARRLGIQPGRFLHRVYAEIGTCAVSADCLTLTPADLGRADQVRDLCEYVGVPWDTQRYAVMEQMHIEPMQVMIARRLNFAMQGMYEHA